MSGIHLLTVPIGNIKDISQNVLEQLNEKSIFFVEDTRVFKSLLNNLGIQYSNKQIDSFHDHSGEAKLKKLIELAKNESVCLCSDAGSPVISDPTYPVIKAAIKAEIPIKVYSGISAVTNALELSGLPPIPFHFHGFLTREKNKRKEFLKNLKTQYGTHLFFEGVARVSETLEVLSELYSNKEIVICREMTKTFETVTRFLGEEYDSLKDQLILKGEFVILFHNDESQNANYDKLEALAQEIVDTGAKPKKIANLLAQILDVPSKEIYHQLKVSK